MKNELTDEQELTLLAQDTNHSMKDELERTVDELEEEVKEEKMDREYFYAKQRQLEQVGDGTETTNKTTLISI